MCMQIQSRMYARCCVQRHRPTEADYRGDRFKDYHRDLKGDNDLLSITQVRELSKLQLCDGVSNYSMQLCFGVAKLLRRVQ